MAAPGPVTVFDTVARGTYGEAASDMVDSANEKGPDPDPEAPALPEAAPVETDTELSAPEPPADAAHGEKTEHAPLAQFASRAGGRPQLAEGLPPEIQQPVDPWPVPIQGLVPPAGAQSFSDLELMRLQQPAAGSARNTRVLVTVLVVAVLALAAGAVGVVARGWSSDDKQRTPVALTSPAAVSPAAVSPSSGASVAAPPPAAGSEDTSPVPTGPVAQSIAPEYIGDLGEICEGTVYWPMMPKRSSTKVPHPILVYGDTGSGDRTTYTMFRAWFLKSKAAEKTWSTTEMVPSQVQMVACLERIAVGKKAKSCTYTSPGSGFAGGTATLYHATYRLHVRETATGKKVLEKKLEADSTECPYSLGVPDDKKAYMEVKEYTLTSTMSKLSGL
ncbi:hypothetical protein Acy02nite_62310 [Actinoplanes cyaneus]|uniref:Uncharacterized protein n=2 Tax=Actinoplanes cyaneus TaxID=52696 RepID=A0A919IUN6_9ACTN|nr:hypothetical protein [Actinoplanes cyaneus]GID68350.1 hypothetical protein Acy02nite_62310 [Actinoplanes cyaneus]